MTNLNRGKPSIVGGTFPPLQSVADVASSGYDDADERDSHIRAAMPIRQSKREWTIAMVEAGARARGVNAEGRLLAVFDVLDDVFHRSDREARAFVVVLADMSKGSALGDVATEMLSSFRALTATLAGEAQLKDVEAFTLSWRVLLKGAIVRAAGGDLDAATRAKEMAADLITHHRATPATTAGITDGHVTLVAAVEPAGTAAGESGATDSRDAATAAARYLEYVNDLQWDLG